MPRKYRPPTTRRRKAKRASVPRFVEPESEVLTPGEDGVSEDPVAVAEPPRAPARPATVEAAPSSGEKPERERAQKHLVRDYSYVRNEVKRIVLVGGFLIVSLIITAILRN